MLIWQNDIAIINELGLILTVNGFTLTWINRSVFCGFLNYETLKKFKLKVKQSFFYLLCATGTG